MFQVIILLSLFISSHVNSFFEVKQSTKEKIVWFASALIVTCAASNFNQQCKRAAPCKTKDEQNEIIELITDWTSKENRKFVKSLISDDKHFEIKPLFESLYNTIDMFDSTENAYARIKSPSGLNFARNTIIETVQTIQKIGATIIKKYDDLGAGVLSKEREILQSDIFDCVENLDINTEKIKTIKDPSLKKKIEDLIKDRPNSLENIKKQKEQFIFDNFTNTLTIVKNNRDDERFLHSFYNRHSAFTEKYFKVFHEKFLDSTKNRLSMLISLMEKKANLEEIHTISYAYEYGDGFKTQNKNTLSLTHDQFFDYLRNYVKDTVTQSNLEFMLETTFQLLQASTNILRRSSCWLCKTSFQNETLCKKCAGFMGTINNVEKGWNNFSFRINRNNTFDGEYERFKRAYSDLVIQECAQCEIELQRKITQQFADGGILIQNIINAFVDNENIIINKQELNTRFKDELSKKFSLYIDYCCAKDIEEADQKYNLLCKDAQWFLENTEINLSNEERQTLSNVKILFDDQCTYETFISAVNDTKSIIEKYNHGECKVCYANDGSPVLCNGVRSSNFLCDTCHDTMQKEYVSDVEGSPIAIVCPYCRGGLIKEENRFVCDATTTTKKKTTAPPPPQDLRQVMRDAGIPEDEINANMGQNQEIGQNIRILIPVEQLHARLIYLTFQRLLGHISHEDLEELQAIRVILQQIRFG